MPVRVSSKALLYHEGKLLLNRCKSDGGTVYYDLPGGGQNAYETMEEALCREVMEETGYTVSVLRLAGVAEEIYSGITRERYPAYAHRSLHIFLCKLEDVPQRMPSETDMHQEESFWAVPEEADTLNLWPVNLQGQVCAMLREDKVFYLGTSGNSVE